jgi:hypothetical protein
LFAPSPCLPEGEIEFSQLLYDERMSDTPFIPPSSKPSLSFVEQSAGRCHLSLSLAPQYPFEHSLPKPPKETSALIISNIPMNLLQELQQLLAQCGAIKVLNTERLSERLKF